ncbi:hypothetical protein GN244_ATG06974 [Phytophthora infestans]|uniref:Uncharacterized protein n=1 Tax=Phytophthora infestans TaxID=4787 RepID=A0A833THF8_PHYIN|nr:hypothetical protein GN244_ATG06974 [Phytophthora infestans]
MGYSDQRWQTSFVSNRRRQNRLRLTTDLNRIKYPADELTFYLATRNGKWLQRWDPDVQQVLKRGPMSDTFMELLSDDKITDPQRPLSDFNLCERQDIWNNEFHVLLELPKGKHYRNRMARRKKERAEQRRKGTWADMTRLKSYLYD